MFSSISFRTKHSNNLFLGENWFWAFRRVIGGCTKFAFDATSLDHGILRGAFALYWEINAAQARTNTGVKWCFCIEVEHSRSCNHPSYPPMYVIPLPICRQFFVSGCV